MEDEEKRNPFREMKKQRWKAILITVAIALLFSLLAIYVVEDYGIAIFVVLPFFIGFCSTLLLGRTYDVSKHDAFEIGLATFFTYILFLLIFAIEGLMCILMLIPFALILVWIGTLVGAYVSNKRKNDTLTMLFVVGALFPLTAFVEKQSYTPTVEQVVSSIIIDAKPEKVWENVIQFPQLQKPNELIFKTGIAYPINATIKGKGVGAIRYCNFTTGAFVEPITRWEENKLLQFDVLEQPIPMKEMSFWDVDAPHLHDYFLSKKGQFELVPLSNGKTKLIGTTWYTNRVKPNFYWNLWSNYIIHQIHNRVLKHIKATSE